MNQKSVKSFTARYINWATDQFNADRKMVPAEMRLSQFVSQHKLTSAMHSAIYWELINSGAL